MIPTPSRDAGARWRATLLKAKDFDLGDFAVAAPPSEDHPRGVVAALSFGELRNEESFVNVVAIDLADERVLASNPVGYAKRDAITDIASTPRGVVVAKQQDTGLELYWFTSGTINADSRTLAALANKKNQELRTFTTFGDRIVLATGGIGTTTVWILDAQGRLLTSHACHGSLFAPGPARLTQMGDDVLVTNFVKEGPNADRVPVCAGRLHGAQLWREVTLHDGVLAPGVGGIYFTRKGGADRATTNALDENLAPTGLPPPPAATPLREPCTGLTGTFPRHAEEIGGLQVVDMESCCGDPGGGLFVCRPQGPEEQGQ